MAEVAGCSQSSLAAQSGDLSELLSGLGESERAEASANLTRVLNILKEWDQQALREMSGDAEATALMRDQ